MTLFVVYIFILNIHGIYIWTRVTAFSLFPFTGNENRNELQPNQIMGTFTELGEPLEFTRGKSREVEEFRNPTEDTSEPMERTDEIVEPGNNKSRGSDLACDAVSRGHFRCCRVYEHLVEAWWCPRKLPFCCDQGTACAVCCTAEDLRKLQNPRLQGAVDCRSRPVGARLPAQPPPLRPPPPQPSAPVDDNWFWNGMRAAWLTMVGVLVASLCFTCVAHKCITYLVKIINEEEASLDEEYLAFHFDNLALMGAEDGEQGRPGVAGRPSQLPPKYSDINFTPVQPEPAVGPPAAPPISGPPPMYTSALESEPAGNSDPEPEPTEITTQSSATPPTPPTPTESQA